MDLKFYLNKFVKVDRVEDYTLSTLITLKERYEKFLDKSEGMDPDFPGMCIGGKGQKITKKELRGSISSDQGEKTSLDML